MTVEIVGTADTTVTFHVGGVVAVSGDREDAISVTAAGPGFAKPVQRSVEIRIVDNVQAFQIVELGGKALGNFTRKAMIVEAKDFEIGQLSKGGGDGSEHVANAKVDFFQAVGKASELMWQRTGQGVPSCEVHTRMNTSFVLLL